jgi:PAS domain S-box-containing protein
MSPRASATQPAQLGSLSAADYGLLVESVGDYAIFMIDPEGRIASWNLGAERIHGYAADEIIGQDFAKLYTEEDRQAGKPLQALASAEQSGRAEDQGWRVRKDGTRRWVGVVMTVLRSASNELRGFGLVTSDLTQDWLASAKLQESEERFHHLVDAVTDYAIFMLDITGHVLTWNVGAQKIKGYEANEVIGQHFSLFYTEQDRAAGKPQRVLETVVREGRYEDEMWRVRKGGVLFWANVVITALRDEHGQVVGFVKVTRDLSDRRAREVQLGHSEERFRLLVEAVHDYAIYMLDPDGVITTWNSGAERMKLYKADEIIGKNFALFFPAEDKKLCKPASELAIARSAGRFEDEGWRIRKDGSRFWANVIVTAVHDAEGRLLGFGKITRDLTLRREAEETDRRLVREQAARAAAQDVAERAEDANRIKDEFLATVSHELRTPLNAIVGWAALLRDRPLEPSVAKAIEVIDRNAQAQVKIVDDILDVSRIITGKLRLELKPTDVLAVAKQGIEVVRPSAAAKSIAISCEQIGPLNPVLADPERLQQVAWNLLSNAIKFTERGGTVNVRVECQGANVLLSVSDTGRGIEPDFLPFVFERFKQADSSSTRRFGGLGLGLAIVRHLIELHGGSVAAVSGGLGLGSTFSVSIPSVAVAAHVPAVESETAAAEVRSSGALAGLRVLIVEDDPDGRELVATVLRRAGALTETASSAAEGFAAVQRVRPDVLVSDIGMAVEDGYSFVRRLQAMHAADGGIPSVALTAYSRAEDRSAALAAGFTTHIAKPVNYAELVAMAV